MIDRHASKLDKRGAAWKLRAELIAFEGSYEEVNKLGGQRVKEIPTWAKAGWRYYRSCH